MPLAITASPHLATPSRAYCIAPTSRSPRFSPSLAHVCPRRKNSNQNALGSKGSCLTGFSHFGFGGKICCRSSVGEESPYRPRLLSSFRNLSQEGVRAWQLPQRPASSRILSPNPRCPWRVHWGRILGNWASPLGWRNSPVNGPYRLVRSKRYRRRSHGRSSALAYPSTLELSAATRLAGTESGCTAPW